MGTAARFSLIQMGAATLLILRSVGATTLLILLQKLLGAAALYIGTAALNKNKKNLKIPKTNMLDWYLALFSQPGTV